MDTTAQSDVPMETQTQAQTVGSNPANAQSAQRVLKFLEDVALHTRGESNEVERKIVQLKAQRKRLRENAKKIRQRIKEQTAKLLSAELQIENIDLNIATLSNIKADDDDDDIDVK